jgi:O-antigen/teichoic acid export membrane protein
MALSPESAWLRLLPTALRQHFRGRHTLNAILANSGWLMGERLSRMIIGVLVGAWVARHLGPASYGELAYVVALVAFFQAAASLGLENIVVRNVSQEPAAAEGILGTALALRVAAGLAGWVLSVGTMALLRPGEPMMLAMAALLGASLLFQPSEVVDLWFQARTRSRVTVPYKLAAYIASAGIKVALILLDAPLWMFAAALLCDVVFAAAALARAYRREPTAGRWRRDSRMAVVMLRESWPLMLAGLSVMIYMRIDQLILGALTSERELGLYSAVIPFSQVWHMVPMTLCASLLPRISVLRQDHPALYRLRLQQLYSLMAWGGIAAAVTTSLLSSWLVAVLLGPVYADAAAILRWHSLSNVFVFLGVAQSVAIISDRTPHLSLLKTVAGAAASVALNLALVPRHGAVGAAWAAVGAYFCASMLTNAVFAPASLAMQIKAFWPYHAQRS